MFFQAHITRIISLALIMFGLSGCSLLSFDSVQDPEVHLLKVQVVKARLTQQDSSCISRSIIPTTRTCSCAA